MSWKVYNAYQWRGGSMDKLFALLLPLRSATWDFEVTRLLSKITPEKFHGNMDEFGKAVDDLIRNGSWFTFHEKFGELSNPSASSVIYLRDGRVFVQFFGVDESLLARHVTPKNGFHDYYWQNSCDGPKHISRRRWKDREKTWRAIFNGHQTPRQAGLTFKIVEEGDGWLLVNSMFERIHGHRAWPHGDEAKGCRFCEELRRKI